MYREFDFVKWLNKEEKKEASAWTKNIQPIQSIQHIKPSHQRSATSLAQSSSTSQLLQNAKQMNIKNFQKADQTACKTSFCNL
jgi:hypothetical protein